MGRHVYTSGIRETARGNVVLFVFDENTEPEIAASLLPLIAALSGGGDPRTVVAAPGPDVDIIETIRDDPDYALQISTVSHFDSVLGQLAAILALEDLEVQFVDHYGRESELQLLPPGEL